MTAASERQAPAKRRQDIAKMVKEAGQDREKAARVWAELEADGKTESFVSVYTDATWKVLHLQCGNLVIEEAFQRKMRQMRNELGWESASPLERLLIERIVLCWHHLGQVEVLQAAKLKEGVSLEAANFYEASVARAERRYLFAIKSLAVLRRLLLPVVQINVAEKQVNLLQSGAVNLVPGTERPASALPAARGSGAAREL